MVNRYSLFFLLPPPGERTKVRGIYFTLTLTSPLKGEE
jgi:hypothetical protein